MLGIGGRGEVIDGLLEDLTAEELDARLERAAEQVRDYLATSGALMVLRSNARRVQAEADTGVSRERARWLLPDFGEYHALVTSVVRQCQGRIDGTGRRVYDRRLGRCCGTTPACPPGPSRPRSPGQRPWTPSSGGSPSSPPCTPSSARSCSGCGPGSMMAGQRTGSPSARRPGR